MSFDPFDTDEWRAQQDAQMELNIAADRWHDFPFNEEAANELRSAVQTYRTARDAWVRLVAAEPAGATPAPADPAKTEQPERRDLLAELAQSIQAHHAQRNTEGAMA